MYCEVWKDIFYEEWNKPLLNIALLCCVQQRQLGYLIIMRPLAFRPYFTIGMAFLTNLMGIILKENYLNITHMPEFLLRLGL